MTLKEFLGEWENGSDKVLVHTSGSTGEPKPMWVSKERMLASARMTCDFLGIGMGGKALLCLPLDYIAGKMMVVRAIERNMEIVEPASSNLSSPLSSFSDFTPADFFQLAAMVPMQVYNTLGEAEGRARLRQIRHLLIGGGAIDDALEKLIVEFLKEDEKNANVCVWSTYGMTETLSHIALRRIDGTKESQWYVPMDGVDVWTGADGTLTIRAPHVCEDVLETHDVAVVREDIDPSTGKTVKKFKITGRTDNIICSGGLKIQAEEVERRLKDCLRVPFIISKCKDEKLGEKIVLVVEKAMEKISGEELVGELEAVCRQVLPRHWVPRKYVFVNQIPLTATGKPARKKAEKLAEEA